MISESDNSIPSSLTIAGIDNPTIYDIIEQYFQAFKYLSYNSDRINTIVVSSSSSHLRHFEERLRQSSGTSVQRRVHSVGKLVELNNKHHRERSTTRYPAAEWQYVQRCEINFNSHNERRVAAPPTKL